MNGGSHWKEGSGTWGTQHSKQAPSTNKQPWIPHCTCDRCQAGGIRVLIWGIRWAHFPTMHLPGWGRALLAAAQHSRLLQAEVPSPGLAVPPWHRGRRARTPLLGGVALPTFYLGCLGVVQGPRVRQGIHHHPAVREGSSQQAQPAHLWVLGMDRRAQTWGSPLRTPGEPQGSP